MISLLNQKVISLMGLISILSLELLFAPNGLGEFTQHRKEILDDNGNYMVDWWIDYDLKVVKFNVSVNTEGFVGFGISPSGGMTGADIVIGGVYPNGTFYFSDRHGVGLREPVIDLEQNWELINAKFQEGHTNLEFSRLFDTCDDQDVILSNDTTSFIWAYSPTGSDEISYHNTTHRGTFTVQPLDPEVPPVDLNSTSTYEITHNMTMPSAETTYWCTIHKSPTFPKKHHIIAFEPKLNSPAAKAHTHHYNIYRCTAPKGTTPAEYFGPYVGGNGGECYVPNPVIPSHDCQTMFYNWAVGGRMLVLPENIGYPIGETGSSVDYYMFEIHYNNPDKLEGEEFETGATIYYTEELREHDAGLMVVAHHTSISLTVPPKSPGFKTVGHCDPICTSNYLPDDGINVFAIFLHAHLSGRKMKFRQFRGNKELPWAANDETYDFEFQQTRPLSQELKILQGDHLTMECIYDTTWAEGTTVGGLSTREEMCQSIFWYYPRAQLRDCRSEYPIEQLFAKFGIESANRSTPYEDAVITSPTEFLGMKYTEVLNEKVEWTDKLRNEIQRDSNNEQHVGVCWTASGARNVDKTGYPEILEVYQPARECGKSAALGLFSSKLSNYLILATVLTSLLTSPARSFRMY